MPTVLDIATLQNTSTKTQGKILSYLKELKGCSLRQISRLTGLTVYKIFKA